jgi:hypothetical protein
VSSIFWKRCHIMLIFLKNISVVTGMNLCCTGVSYKYLSSFVNKRWGLAMFTGKYGCNLITCSGCQFICLSLFIKFWWLLLSFWNYKFLSFLLTFLVSWRFFKAWHSLNQSSILAAYYNNSWDFILNFRLVTTLKNERKVFLGLKVVIRR